MAKGFAPILIVIFITSVLVLGSTLIFKGKILGKPVINESPSPEASVEISPAPETNPEASPAIKKSVSPSPKTSPASSPNLGPTPSVNVKLESIEPKEQKIEKVIALKGSGFGGSQCNGQQCGTAFLFLVSDPSKHYGLVNDDRYWTDTRIDAQVFDVSKGDYKAVVMNWKGEYSNQLDFKVTVGKPVVKSITPDPVSEGGTITISGSEFGDSPGSVYFNKPGEATRFTTCSVESWSDTKFVCKLSSSVHSNVRYTIDFVTGDGRGSGGDFDVHVK